ncbi:hypothetical protein H7H73_05445 [Mycobacterium rufum]|uniref:Uncharacterized protein n=1 Tax=Mycolicibacterium rufum TaxID=318424 RepID=A0A9X2YA77_9MYCO|nr:hypothetical protein [Mycolicibacterium rufum]
MQTLLGVEHELSESVGGLGGFGARADVDEVELVSQSRGTVVYWPLASLLSNVVKMTLPRRAARDRVI